MHGKNNLVVVIVVALVVIVGAVVVFKSGVVSGQAISSIDHSNLRQGYGCVRDRYGHDYNPRFLGGDYSRCAIGLECRQVIALGFRSCLRPVGQAAPGSICFQNDECGSGNCVGGEIWSQSDQRFANWRLGTGSTPPATRGLCASASGVVPQTGTVSGAGGGRSSGRQTYRN